MNNKSLTVIMPVHNNGLLLADSIESLKKQNTKEILDWTCELIIVNDASTDKDTINILNDVPSTIGAFRTLVVHNKCSLGAGGARNTGILHSSSKWIAFLDADDLLLEDSINTRLRFIESQKSIRFLASDMYVWDEYTNAKYPGKQRYTSSDTIIRNRTNRDKNSPDGFFLKDSFKEFLTIIPAHPNTVIIDKSLLAECGLFNCQLKRGQDIDLWRRLALLTDMFYIDRPTAVYRVNHDVQLRMRGNWYDYDLMSIDSLIANTTTTDYRDRLIKLKHRILLDKIYHNSKIGNIRSVINTYTKALITKPLSIANLRYLPQLIYVFFNRITTSIK